MTEKFISKVRERQAVEAKEKKRRQRSRRRREDLRERALEAANGNSLISVGDHDELGVRAVIDPTEGEHLLRVGKGPPMRMANGCAPPRNRVVSLRGDPVGKMAKLGRLGTDPADRDVRLMAARKWQEYYEAACPEGGLDPFAEAVDGGRVDDIAEARLTAVKQLSRVAGLLGIRNGDLILKILGERYSLEEHLQKSGLLEGSANHRQKTIDAYLQIFRNCLDDVAEALGLRAVGPARRRNRDIFDFLSRFVSSPRLYDTMRAQRELDAGG